MRFSERMNLVHVSDVMQKNDMNDDLRISLWNYFYLLSTKDYGEAFGNSLVTFLCITLYKEPVDELNHYSPYGFIKRKILNDNWNVVYDMLEVCYEFIKGDINWGSISRDDFAEVCNSIFEKENSAYRFVNGKITPITDENEIKSIEDSINEAPLTGIKAHFVTALSLLSDREHPDYRNSIKESISAVEAICRQITGESTLDRAMPKLKAKNIQIPSMLEEGIKKMYYFTNDKNGIRHALMDDSTALNYEEAKYMLVVCSAFVNYLIAKQA